MPSVRFRDASAKRTFAALVAESENETEDGKSWSPMKATHWYTTHGIASAAVGRSVCAVMLTAKPNVSWLAGERASERAKSFDSSQRSSGFVSRPLGKDDIVLLRFIYRHARMHARSLQFVHHPSRAPTGH